MKVLLIYPPNINLIVHNWPELFEKAEMAYPPLGLLYIASYMQNHTSHKVSILDTQVEKLSYFDIENKIRGYDPDIVGIYTSTFLLIDAIKVAGLVKCINRNIHINLGGPHPTLFPAETVKLPDIDSLTIGEGEATFTELVENISNGKSLYEINGLIFKENNRIIANDPRPFLEDLDSLPFPKRQLLPYKDYYCFLSRYKFSTLMVTSRGCPYNCIFCYRVMGNKFRKRSVNNVVDEIQECCDLGIRDIFFSDDTFTINKKRVISLCDEIIKRRLTIDWEVKGRADSVDREMLKKMRVAGCRRIGFGIEAGTQKSLDILKKKITLEQAKNAVKWTKDAGMLAYADFMLGLPGETKDDIIATVKFAKDLRLDYVEFTIATPYPETELFKLGKAKKLIDGEKWRVFAGNQNCDFKPDFWTEHLSADELVKLMNNAYRSFYLRPHYIFQRLKKIRSIREFIRHFKAGLRVARLR